MGRKLRLLVGSLKDKASMTRATLLYPCSSLSAAAELAVLRATAHHPPSSPPQPCHLASLLSFGRGSRLTAAALSSALSSRLLSTRDPSVALKSLLSFHLLLRSAPFILFDQIYSSLSASAFGRRHRRSPLLLSSFPLGSDPLSWSLTSCIRWYSRLLELLILLPPPIPFVCGAKLSDWVSSLVTRDLVAEIDSLVEFFGEASRPPETLPSAGNRLVSEVLKLVAGDRLAAQHGILVRLREIRERFGSAESCDSVQLVCMLLRLEACHHHQPLDWKWMAEDEYHFWREVEKVREMAEMDSERVMPAIFSTRIAVRSAEPARFGSDHSHL
ncbi:Putative clathrin assembly protein [Apostasia shenzhenica]|uniref:Clathrin assembly protein n=1 Tax=Apostasia shenzhenica TaxID=1088818 RepID=A0A2I0A3A5_9ASPA|nr:Putative clathrin assembly protein [Apostasia shenzhenica]